MPLILIPYLVRTLGMTSFGDWVFATSFAIIARTIVSYGFDLTATRSVAIRQQDRSYISKLLVSIGVIRLTLLLVCCVGVVALSAMSQRISEVLVLALVSMLVLVGEAIFPVWLFQGMEEMSSITKVRLSHKLAFVALVVLLVRSAQDVLLVPVIEATTSLAAGVAATWIACGRFRLAIVLPGIDAILAELRQGFSVCVSQLAIHFYTTINVVLLGFMMGPVAVGQYAIAEKVYSAIRGMLGPVVQALFPVLSKSYADDVGEFGRAVRGITGAFVVGLVALSVLMLVTADPIVALVAGRADSESAAALRVLAVSLCFAFGTFLSPLLIVQERRGAFARITLLTMVTNLVVVVPLIGLLGVVGAAVAFLAVQAVHSVLLVRANWTYLGGSMAPLRR